MAQLFSVRAPLLIRSPHGGEKLIAELFPHPNGLIFFEIFWNHMADGQGLHLLEGPISGEGPWKVGEYVISVLGCHGSHRELAVDFSNWQMYLQSPMNEYPSTEQILALARKMGHE